MRKKILFDTLNYAKMLTNDGVEHADTHSKALSEVLGDNLYSQHETDKMIDAALRRFDERTAEIREEMRQNREELREEMREERLRIEQRFNQQSHEIKEVRNDLLLKINDMQDHILKKVYFALSLFLAGIALLSVFTHLLH